MSAAAMLIALCANPETVVADIFRDNGFDNPPAVVRVSSDHPVVARPGSYDHLAAAVLTESGKEFILYNEDATSGDCEDTLRHEVAHIITWRRFGVSVRMHGGEFRKVCRSTKGATRGVCR